MDDDDDNESFSPKACRAIAESNPAILDMLADAANLQNPQPGAPGETWGAHAGRLIVESPTTLPWSDNLFPVPWAEPRLPPFVRPRGDRDDVWWHSFYLGMLCAFAWYMDATDAQDPNRARANKGLRALAMHLRHSTHPGN